MGYIVYTCTEPPAGGLADRLKGIVSCYGLSRALNRDFLINWTFPHKINSILKPNKINWSPRPIQGTHSVLFLIDNDNYKLFEPSLQDNTFSSYFNTDIVSVRTNINFLNYFNLKFSNVFNDLFDDSLLGIDNLIKPETLGVSCRFGGTQANWAGDPDFNKTLSYDYVYEEIIRLLEEKKCSNLFLCSDSNNFIDFCKEKKLYPIVTEGYSEHIDRSSCTFDGFKKSFVDFFALRKCRYIASIKGEFGKTAALSVDKEHIVIN